MERIYFTSEVESTQGSATLRIPADVYEHGDYGNSTKFRLWTVTRSPADKREEEFALYVLPFGDTEPSEIFYIGVRIQSRAATFSPVLQCLAERRINVIYCSSIDMGDMGGADNRGEPADLLVEIPTPLCGLLRRAADSITVGQNKTTPEQYLNVLLELIKQLSNLEPVQQELAQLLASDHDDNTLDEKLKSLQSEIESCHAAKQPIDQGKLYVSNVLAAHLDQVDGDQWCVTEHALLRDVLFADLARKPEIHTALQRPMHFSSSLVVEKPDGLGDLPKPPFVESRPTYAELFDDRQPGLDTGRYSMRLPQQNFALSPYATLTYYWQSHLLKATFKNREEVILSLGVNFKNQSGELRKIIDPLGRLNVDLRLVTPLTEIKIDREFPEAKITRGLVYEIVGNIRSSKLRVFAKETLEDVISAELGVPRDNLKILKIVPPIDGYTISFEEAHLANPMNPIKTGASPQVNLFGYEGRRSGEMRYLIPRGLQLFEVVCLTKLRRVDAAPIDQLTTVLNTCVEDAVSANVHAMGSAELNKWLLTHYSEAIYSLTLARDLLDVYKVLKEIRSASSVSTIRDAISQIGRDEGYFLRARRVVEFDFVPFFRRATYRCTIDDLGKRICVLHIESSWLGDLETSGQTLVTALGALNDKCNWGLQQCARLINDAQAAIGTLLGFKDYQRNLSDEVTRLRGAESGS